ncbi:unnamed protein product [Didymodactylos carnosus]|uniref:NAD(+)--protein-arginine ADP-ribosyltransferase n=1 Tax=Didymodactylos carnosus TaxID=1234261 RepID=A0A814AGM8_9BILA|nr:unnamed protein product [Didymodactylos carnosus]CAF0911899.1 unnamed protein product [Didymodactylos carnosus]CAF3560421.1 unnamed protein product [Didymodactylos carnosus]CAF3692843.1 unnamed protein product [Didymodactylos carnosus]
MASKDKCTYPLSQLYIACQDGNIDLVRQLLEVINLEQINCRESNGSTALHAACYYGHYDIVKLLLDNGACRTILNAHKCAPFDEAKDDKIRQLFLRPDNERFVGGNQTGQKEWMKVDPDIHRQAINKRLWLKSAWNETKMLNRIEWMIDNYLRVKLRNPKDFQLIEKYFRQALEYRDPRYFITAYTADTRYYHQLNEDFASEGFEPHEWTTSMPQWIVSSLYSHPAFDKYSYKGFSYRGQKMSDVDLVQYVQGSCIMNKSFQSTSEIRAIAEEFACDGRLRRTIDGNKLKRTALFIFEIRNSRTALKIDKMSVFENEAEVLILPYAAFKVVKVIQNPPLSSQNNKKLFANDLEFEIHLKECKSLKKEVEQNLKFAFTNAHQPAMLDDDELERELNSFSF